jgi:YD repeat-containing protein
MNMKKLTYRNLPAEVLRITGMLVVTCMMTLGCSDTKPVQAPPPQAPTPSPTLSAPSIESFNASLGKAKSDVDAALGALTKLTDPTTTDLRLAYDEYSDRLARIVQGSETVRREAGAMRSSRAAYFQKWEDRMMEIDNPTIRATAEQRRIKLRDAHERITTATLAAGDAYDPFIRDLQDVRKFLAPDLSRQSVNMLGDIQKKCLENGNVLKQKIDLVISELNAIQAGAM